MAFDVELAGRVRLCLGERTALEVREVAMFGGRSFMVDGHLAVAASSDGSLLVRVAPGDLDRSLERDGARPAEMRGRPMSPGWIRVDIDAVGDHGVLEQWIDDAIAHVEKRATGD